MEAGGKGREEGKREKLRRANKQHVFFAKEDSLRHTKGRMELCLLLPFFKKRFLYLKLGAGGGGGGWSPAALNRLNTNS